MTAMVRVILPGALGIGPVELGVLVVLAVLLVIGAVILLWQRSR